MEKLKAAIKSRRGIAMELAIGVMFITVALSILLFSNALLQNSKGVQALDDLEKKVLIGQMLEYTKDYVENNENGIEVPLDSIDKTNDVYIVSKGDITLEVTFGADGKITSWQEIKEQ